MNRYTEKVDPGKFDYVAEMIDNRFDSEQPDSIVRLAVCHKLLFDEIDYQVYSGVTPPNQTLDRLKGDCTDHSILLASLYKACGLDTALLIVEAGTSRHMLVEVKNPLNSIDETCRRLREFYWKHFDLYAETIAYEKHRGSYWMPIDTAGDQGSGWSTYVGDISSHIDSCIYEKPGGEWEWNNLEERTKV